MKDELDKPYINCLNYTHNQNLSLTLIHRKSCFQLCNKTLTKLSIKIAKWKFKSFYISWESAHNKKAILNNGMSNRFAALFFGIISPFKKA